MNTKQSHVDNNSKTEKYTLLNNLFKEASFQLLVILPDVYMPMFNSSNFTYFKV